jgi:hypothetical protein
MPQVLYSRPLIFLSFEKAGFFLKLHDSIRMLIEIGASGLCRRQERKCHCGFWGRAILARCWRLNSGFPMHSPPISRPNCSFRRCRSTAAASNRPSSLSVFNIIAAGSDDEARRPATTQQMSLTNIFRGARGLSQPSIDDIKSYWSPAEKAQAMSMLARSSLARPIRFVQVSMRSLWKQALTSSWSCPMSTITQLGCAPSN